MRIATPLVAVVALLPAVVCAQPTDPLAAYRASEPTVQVVPWLTLQVEAYDWTRIKADDALKSVRAEAFTPEGLDAAIKDLIRFHERNALTDVVSEARDPHHVRALAWFVDDALRTLRGLRAVVAKAAGKPADPLNAFRTRDGKVDVRRLLDKKLLWQPEASTLSRKTLTEIQRAVIMSMGGVAAIPHGELAKLNERTAELLYRPRLKLERLVNLSDEQLRAEAEAKRIKLPEQADRVEILQWMTGKGEADIRAATGIAKAPEVVPERITNPKFNLEELSHYKPTELVEMASEAGIPIPEGMKDRSEMVRYMTGRDGESIFDIKRQIVDELERGGNLRIKVWEGDWADSEGFATRRPAARGESAEASAEVRGELQTVFEDVRRAAFVRLRERERAGSTPAERAAIGNGADDLRSLRLTVVETADVIAEHQRGEVRISTGLLNAIAARADAQVLDPADRPRFRRAVLGLIVAHEAAHASGVKVERVADTEGLNILERAGQVPSPSSPEVRAALAVFEGPTGAGHVDALFARLRSLFRYGSLRGRRANMERAMRGEADPLATYRRPDGTVRWRPAMRDRALQEVGGLAHFGLALFLKELATVAATGDDARIGEFFDALTTSDFYENYGLFVLGARGGEVLYGKFLQRYVKPQFVSGVLRSSVALAAGLALPQIAAGRFQMKTFAISLGALSISTAAVRGTAGAIRWLVDLRRARSTGALAGLATASRWARVGGWFYTAAELAVILIAGEQIENAVNAYLDRQAALDALADAGEAFADAAGDPRATPESIGAAADTYHEAWIDYRNYLYRPLFEDEAVLAGRLSGVARKAKLAVAQRTALVARVRHHDALNANILTRYDTLDAYAAALTRKDDAGVMAELGEQAQSYEESRAAHLHAIYEEGRRGTPLLDGVSHLAWNVLGAAAGSPEDTYGERTDVAAVFARRRLARAYRGALEDASPNRLESYTDEAEVLRATADALRARGREDLAATIAAPLALVENTRRLDERVAKGLTPTAATGATSLLEARLGD